MNILSNHFKCNYDELVSEIRIKKKDDTTPKKLTKSSTSILHIWLQWLNMFNRNVLFNNFSIILKKFSVIPVTSCKCERSFSKLTQVKSKY